MTISTPRTARRPGRVALSTSSASAPTSNPTLAAVATTPLTRARSRGASGGLAPSEPAPQSLNIAVHVVMSICWLKVLKSGDSTVASMMARSGRVSRAWRTCAPTFCVKHARDVVNNQQCGLGQQASSQRQANPLAMLSPRPSGEQRAVQVRKSRSVQAKFVQLVPHGVGLEVGAQGQVVPE